MTFSPYLEKGSLKAKLANAIHFWVRETQGLCAGSLLVHGTISAEDAAHPDAAPDADARFRRHLGALDAAARRMLSDATDIYSLSVRENAEAVDLFAIQHFGAAFTTGMTGKDFGVRALAENSPPIDYWRRLAESVNDAMQILPRAIEAGKKPATPPAGMFGKLGRAISKRETAAPAKMQEQLDKLLGDLEQMQRELRFVLEEMDKG